MFDKQIQKFVDSIGDETKAINILGYATIALIIIFAIVLYIIWRPQPTPNFSGQVSVPGPQLLK